MIGGRPAFTTLDTPITPRSKDPSVKLIYTPEGGTPHEWRLKDPSDLRRLEPEYIEEAGGPQWGTWLEWANILGRGGYRAIRVLLWVMLRRTNPDLDLNEVQPQLTELQFDPDDDVEIEPGKEETPALTPPADASIGSESPNAV